MRLFVAADLAPSAIDALQQEVARLKEAAPFDFIRWIPEASWHITVAFLGDLDIERLGQVEVALQASIPTAVEPVRPVGMKLYPNQNKARLIAMQLQPSHDLFRIFWQVINNLGLPRERKDYDSHVTVARFKDLSASDGSMLQERLGGPNAEGIWAISSITLYESTLDPGGAQYRSLATWPLG